MIGLRRPGGAGWPADLAHRCWEHHRVHVSVRGGVLRVSPHVYNDEGDVARLVAALDAEVPRAGSPGGST